MDFEEARDVIRLNAATSPNFSDQSFTGRLHEERVWSTADFEILLEAVSILSRRKTQDPEIRAMAFDIFSYIVSVALLAHVNPNDSLRIRNIDDETIFDLRNDIEAAFGRLLGFRPSA